MENKIREALRKTWEELTPNDRKSFIKEMEQGAIFPAIAGLSIATALQNPTNILFPVSALYTFLSAVGTITVAEVFSPSIKKFASKFEDNLGFDIRDAVGHIKEKLLRSYEKLKEVL